MGLRTPMNRAVQRGCASFTMLLKPQVQSGQGAVRIRDAVDGEPPQERIAAPSLAVPAEASRRRIIEWVTLEAAVRTGLELGECAGTLEVPRPLLISADADGKVAAVCRHGKDGACLGVVIRLTPTDVITGVALELDEVRGRAPADARDP